MPLEVACGTNWRVFGAANTIRNYHYYYYLPFGSAVRVWDGRGMRCAEYEPRGVRVKACPKRTNTLAVRARPSVQHMLSWPKGSLRTNGRRMPSSGATLTSKLGSICRCLHFCFGFPPGFLLFVSLYFYLGILLHSKQPNHFKEAAPLQQFLLTSDKEHECGREGKRQQQPQPQSGSWWDEKREQQDKPLKGYQDMSSTAPRQIGKGWRKGLRARERTSWGVMPTSILHRCSSTHLTPRPCPESRLLPGLSLQIQIETQTRAHVPQWTRVPQPASAGRERRNNNHRRGRSSQQIYKILENNEWPIFRISYILNQVCIK